MDPGSVWLSVLGSFVIFVGLLVFYVRKIHPKGLACLRIAYNADQKKIIHTSGLDTAVYFIFYETVFKIFLSGLVFLPILIPLAATDTSLKSITGTSSGAFIDYNKWSIGNIEENSPRLYAFVVAIYSVSLFTMTLLENAYDRVSDLRDDALMSTEMRPEEFAVLVRDIPPSPRGQSRKDQVDSYFKRIYPNSYYGSLVCLDGEKVEKVGKIWKQLEGYKKKLAKAKAIFAESKGNKLEGIRPTTKTRFFGLIGERVDSIEYYHERVNELVPRLKDLQRISLIGNQSSSALVFFTDSVTAASASQSLTGRRFNWWTVMEAPEPRQLLRSYLYMDGCIRQLNKIVNHCAAFACIMLYACPIAFLAAFTSLDNLGELLPFFKLHIVDQYAIKIILEAFVPQITLLVVMAILPKLLIIILETHGTPSRSCLERDAAGKFFLFTVFVVIIGIPGFETLIASWRDIEKNPQVFISTLANSIPATATFFMTFVAFKSFVVYGLELSRIIPSAIYNLKKKYICKTKEDVTELFGPVSVGYSTRLPGDMLVFAVVLCYSVISPVILPVGMLYFSIGWLVLRNQVLSVYVSSYESYGRIWPHINNRIFASLVLFQVIMIGYLGLKRFYGCILILPLLMNTLRHAWGYGERYSRFFEARSLEVTCRKEMNAKSMEKIVASYIQPSMQDVEGLADESISSSANGKHLEDQSGGFVEEAKNTSNGIC